MSLQILGFLIASLSDYYSYRDYHSAAPELYLGTWNLLISHRCLETWQFQDDGILVIHSAREITEHRYRIDAHTDDIDELRFHTITDNNGPDCLANSHDDTGRHSQAYIALSSDQHSLIHCYTSQRDDCWRLYKAD